MAFFGLVGNDREMAKTTYSGQESASARAERKRAEREERKSQQRRASHRRNATSVFREGQAWEDAERRREQRRMRS